MARDHYDVLGVEPGASAAQIKAAYRRLLKEWHPDRNHGPDATARMQEINAAYDCLKDPLRRAAYDRWREAEASRARSSEQARQHGGEEPREQHTREEPRQRYTHEEPKQQPYRSYTPEPEEKELKWGIFTGAGFARFCVALVGLWIGAQVLREPPPAPPSPAATVQQPAAQAAAAPAAEPRMQEPKASPPAIDHEAEARREAEQKRQRAEAKRKHAELRAAYRASQVESLKINAKSVFDVEFGKSICAGPLLRGSRCQPLASEKDNVIQAMVWGKSRPQFATSFWPYNVGLLVNGSLAEGPHRSGMLGRLEPEARKVAERILMRAGFTRAMLDACEYARPQKFRTKDASFACGNQLIGPGAEDFAYTVFMHGQYRALMTVSDKDLIDSYVQVAQCANKACDP